MSTLAKNLDYQFSAVDVRFTENLMHVSLYDGREISVPLEFYPRLRKASPEHLNKFELLGHGTCIHWPEIDEDLSVEGIVLGIPSRF